MRKRRHRVEIKDRSSPTPETVAKLQSDPLEALKLEPDLEKSADEIKRVCHVVYGKTLMHLSSLERFEKGVTIMPDWIAEAHSERFLPWARSISASGVEATVDICLHRRESPGNGNLVIRALSDYAKRF